MYPYHNKLRIMTFIDLFYSLVMIECTRTKNHYNYILLNNFNTLFLLLQYKLYTNIFITIIFLPLNNILT